MNPETIKNQSGYLPLFQRTLRHIAYDSPEQLIHPVDKRYGTMQVIHHLLTLKEDEARVQIDPHQRFTSSRLTDGMYETYRTKILVDFWIPMQLYIPCFVRQINLLKAENHSGADDQSNPLLAQIHGYKYPGLILDRAFLNKQWKSSNSMQERYRMDNAVPVTVQAGTVTMILRNQHEAYTRANYAVVPTPMHHTTLHNSLHKVTSTNSLVTLYLSSTEITF